MGTSGRTKPHDPVTESSVPDHCVTLLALRVRFSKPTDGIVHHATYLTHVEAGRVEYLRRRGADYRALMDRGFHMPVVEAKPPIGARLVSTMSLSPDASRSADAGYSEIRLRGTPGRRAHRRGPHTARLCGRCTQATPHSAGCRRFAPCPRGPSELSRCRNAIAADDVGRRNRNGDAMAA
jgi:hypothetical protein